MEAFFDLVKRHPALAGLLVAGFALWGLFAAARRRRQLATAPLIKAKGAFIGLVQIEGTVGVPNPVRGYLTEQDCAWYRYDVSEHWRRTVVETTTDANGRPQTRTRTESGWSSVMSGGKERPFDIHDDTGAIRVNPENATVDAPVVFDVTVSIGQALYYGKGPPGAVSGSTGERRFTEHALMPGEPTYVVGTARERTDVAELEIAQGEMDPLFLIDKDGHKSVTAGYGWRAGGFLFVALAAMATGLWYALPKPELFAEGMICLATFVGAYFVGFCVATINGLADVRRRVDQAKSNLDVHLKRRHDLLPRLVECVKGYAAHEKELLATIGRDGGAAVAERYPALASQPVFAKLQAELADTEERVALARGYFANAVTLEAAATESFPTSLFARALGSDADESDAVARSESREAERVRSQ